MHLTLKILLRPAEGALVRALGLIERRGYALRRVVSDLREDLCVELDVETGTRSPEPLVRRIESLVDVRRVEVVGPS